MGYEEHLKEFRTGASNSKATRLIELFGKTFSPEKVFVLPRFPKSANLSSNFFQLWKKLNYIAVLTLGIRENKTAVERL